VSAQCPRKRREAPASKRMRRRWVIHHGSERIIRTPVYHDGKPYNDAQVQTVADLAGALHCRIEDLMEIPEVMEAMEK